MRGRAGYGVEPDMELVAMQALLNVGWCTASSSPVALLGSVHHRTEQPGVISDD
jgi:hypothetical protein